MKIIIAGAGAVGTHLAKLLSGEKQDIILMDEDESRLNALGGNLDLMTVNLSPTSINGLKEAGVAGADLFIGVMPDESRNMTACMLATSMGAKKTVARIDNYEYLLPKHKEFFARLGVHSLIYPEMLAARDIVDAVKMSWIRQWWEFAGGALVLIGTKMGEAAEILNVPLYELGGRNIPFHIVAVKRGPDTIIPRGDDMIKLNDIVYFTTTKKYIPYIRKIYEEHFETEVAHLKTALDCLMKYENKAPEALLKEADFPETIKFGSNKKFIREVLERTVELTADKDGYTDVKHLDKHSDFAEYQRKINADTDSVASHEVIERTIKKFGNDYRYEDAPNPVSALRPRTKDNTSLGRISQ